MKPDIWLFSLRLLWRERRVSDVVILFVALLIAVTQTTTVNLFTDRLQRMLTQQTAEFLAADLAIVTTREIPETWLEKAAATGLTLSQTHEFSSVLLVRDALLLTRIKAVSDRYPLRGQLKARSDLPGAVQARPRPGTVWVDGRVLSSLKLTTGDSIQVGESTLTITHELLSEPDQPMNLTALAPRVLMHADDLANTRLVQPGSHVHHRLQLTGAEADIDTYRQWLNLTRQPGERLLDLHTDRPEFGSTLAQAKRYLGLISTGIMVMAGVAVAMAIRRYTVRQYDQIALLQCLGCTRNDILQILAAQWLGLGLLAGGLGCGLGWAAHTGLFYLLQDLLPQQQVPPGMLAGLEGWLAGWVILAGFALPRWWGLLRVTPLRVLRRDLEPRPLSAWLVQAMTLGLVAGMVVWHTRDLRLTLILIGVSLAGLLILGGLAYGVLAVLKRLPISDAGWHLACRSLLRHRLTSVGQMLGFSLILLVMILSWLVRNDLLTRWQAQLPAGSPNHFILNLFPEQREAFETALTTHGVHTNRLYPVARGRLVTINDQPVQNRVARHSEGEQATQRELGLTWAATLPDGNQLSAGQWWPQGGVAGQASVEQKLADSLGLKLGDTLGFTLGSSPLTATVTSFRHLHWGSLQPNFYVVLSPGTLDTYPVTYLTSIHLPPQDQAYLNTLVQTFPNLTPVDVSAVIHQLQGLVSQLTAAVQYLLVFALLAGGLVLAAAITMTLDSRRQEAALLRTLGASRTLLVRSHWLEFGLLGLVSGLIAALLSEAVLYGLYTRLMEIPYQPHWLVMVVAPLGNALLLAGLGRSGLKTVLTCPPLEVLRSRV